MTDVSHQFGSDLTLSPAGDLALVTGTNEGRQRVLRRILTGAGNYIWHPDYGGSAPELIGSLATPEAVEASMLAQMLQEQAVSQLPPPTVDTIPINNGLAINIQYVDALTGDPAALAFSYTP